MRVGVLKALQGRVVGSLPVLAIALAALLFVSPNSALAACDPAAADNVTATCRGVTINQDAGAPGTSAGFFGYGSSIEANVTVTVLSGASVTSTAGTGIAMWSGSIVNLGTITGGSGVFLDSGGTVVNSGSITGGVYGVSGNGVWSIENLGTISGGFRGISITGASGTTNRITNSGSITGGNIGIYVTNANVSSNITNSGTIIGGNGTAIHFSDFSSSDSLTVLPGARFGGLVDFGGGADTVNFGPGNWILYTANFDAALSSINTGGNPFWVTPNSIVVANMSSFGAINRAMPDITNWISSVLPESPVFEPATSAAASAFAAIQQVSPRVEDAFAQFPGGAVSPSTMSYAPATPVFKGGSVSDGSGNMFWAKGFAGRRDQDTTGNLIGSVTKGYGGAIGYDHKFNPAFQVGGFVGMSDNTTTMNLNLGSTNIDTAFGGGYVRTLMGPAFLDLSLVGGQLDNQSKRNIGGGLNLETATANYGGWFVNPAAALGYRYAVANGVTLTPAVKVRYLKSSFDSYTETGSNANLTVAGWDSAVWEERAELSLASVQYFGGDQRILFRVTGGALAQQRQGDSNIGLTFAGSQLFALAPDQRRVNGWYGSAGFDWQRGAFAVFASGEITDTSDAAVSYSGKGGVRVVW